MKLIMVVFFLLKGCAAAPEKPTGSISLSYNGGGCPIVCTLDGGSAVTLSGSVGSSTLWTGLSGVHQVAIVAGGGTNSCSVNVTGPKTISITNICSAGPLVSCP